MDVRVLPENMAAKSEITHSGEFCPIMATERCRLMPTWMKPRATNSTSLRYRSYVHVFQSPFRLTLSAITCKKIFNILSPAINWVCSEKKSLKLPDKGLVQLSFWLQVKQGFSSLFAKFDDFSKWSTPIRRRGTLKNPDEMREPAAFFPEQVLNIFWKGNSKYSWKFLWSKFLCVFQTLKGSYLVSLIMHARALKKFTFKVTVFFQIDFCLEPPLN